MYQLINKDDFSGVVKWSSNIPERDVNFYCIEAQKFDLYSIMPKAKVSGNNLVEDIETAIRTTLQKFEHQSGIHSELEVSGQGLPLAPDVQIQVMHVIQEALSNIRKHSKASNVRVQVRQSPNWEFEVVDDGVGFEAAEDFVDSTHVGLSIMKERAMKIGARLDVGANIPRGAKITLTLAS